MDEEAFQRKKKRLKLKQHGANPTTSFFSVFELKIRISLKFE